MSDPELEDLRAYRRAIWRHRARRGLPILALLLVFSGCTGCWWWLAAGLVRLGLEDQGFEVHHVRPAGLCTFSYEASRRTVRPDGRQTVEHEGGTWVFYFCPVP